MPIDGVDFSKKNVHHNQIQRAFSSSTFFLRNSIVEVFEKTSQFFFQFPCVHYTFLPVSWLYFKDLHFSLKLFDKFNFLTFCI